MKVEIEIDPMEEELLGIYTVLNAQPTLSAGLKHLIGNLIETTEPQTEVISNANE